MRLEVRRCPPPARGRAEACGGGAYAGISVLRALSSWRPAARLRALQRSPPGFPTAMRTPSATPAASGPEPAPMRVPSCDSDGALPLQGLPLPPCRAGRPRAPNALYPPARPLPVCGSTAPHRPSCVPRLAMPLFSPRSCWQLLFTHKLGYAHDALQHLQAQYVHTQLP